MNKYKVIYNSRKDVFQIRWQKNGKWIWRRYHPWSLTGEFVLFPETNRYYNLPAAQKGIVFAKRKERKLQNQRKIYKSLR